MNVKDLVLGMLYRDQFSGTVFRYTGTYGEGIYEFEEMVPDAYEDDYIPKNDITFFFDKFDVLQLTELTY